MLMCKLAREIGYSQIKDLRQSKTGAVKMKEGVEEKAEFRSRIERHRLQVHRTWDKNTTE